MQPKTWRFARLLLLFVLLSPVRLTAKALVGVASWYGRAHAGKRMANGKKFDPRRLTAASWRFPLGQKVHVTYLRSKKHVDVVITDRPGNRRRILDLSEAAAKVLGLRARGIGKVRVEVLKSQGSR